MRSSGAVLSYRQISKALGVSVPTVRSIEFRALKKCRAALLRDCPDDFEDVRQMVNGNDYARGVDFRASGRQEAEH